MTVARVHALKGAAVGETAFPEQGIAWGATSLATGDIAVQSSRPAIFAWFGRANELRDPLLKHQYSYQSIGGKDGKNIFKFGIIRAFKTNVWSIGRPREVPIPKIVIMKITGKRDQPEFQESAS